MSSRARSVVRQLDAGLSGAAACARGGIELLKGPGLESLVPDDEPIAIPQEDLDAIATSIEEEEEVTREGILPKEFPNHALETIESFSHIRRLGAEENCARRRGVEGTSVVSPAARLEFSGGA